MRLRTENVSDLERLAQKSHAAMVYLVAFILLLAFSAGNAWSYAPTDASLPLTKSGLAPSGVQPHNPVPTSTNADYCLPLLKSIHTISSESAFDRSQRTAGQIAVSTFAENVRFAPGQRSF